MSNPLSFYDLKVIQITENVGAWQVKCHRCGLTAQTSLDGPHRKPSDLTMIINTHICDPEKRALSFNPNS